MSMNNNLDGKRLDCSRDDARYVSRTKQCFKDECNINIIVERAAAHGLPPAPPPAYGNVDHISPESFLEMKNKISAVKGVFDLLPSELRREYGSPEGYLMAEGKRIADAQSAEGISPKGEDLPSLIKDDSEGLVPKRVESVKEGE